MTATLAQGDHRPALTWEGSVDGVAVLRIQGDRVDVDTRDGNVSQTNHRFVTPLPAVNDRIEVENRARGTARIRILEQPRRNNDFTATVEVSTSGRRPEPVALDFYWADNRNASNRNSGRYDRDGYQTRSRTNDRAPANSAGLARWSGEVDNEVFVLLRGRQVLNTSVRGRSVSNQQSDISNPLPRRPVQVALQEVQGRGQVELAEQPDDSNNYTAKIRIVDPQAGAGAYSFTLSWDQEGLGDQSVGGVLSPGSTYGNPEQSVPGGARWTGQIDGRVRVSFRGNQAYAQRLTGAEVYGEQVAFGSSVPRRNVDVSVNKLRGRGEVSVVQRPSANNNYTAIVEINDSDGGSDVYELELLWR